MQYTLSKQIKVFTIELNLAVVLRVDSSVASCPNTEVGTNHGGEADLLDYCIFHLHKCFVYKFRRAWILAEPLMPVSKNVRSKNH